MDTNHDGQLSREEIKRAFDKHTKFMDTENVLNEIFSLLDVNKNNTIDFSEFLLATTNYKLELHQKELRQIFDIIDVDKSGTLSMDELRQFFNLKGKQD
jgi:calcium-dependent protein kinase